MDKQCGLSFPLPDQLEIERGAKSELLEQVRDAMHQLPMGDLGRSANYVFKILHKTNGVRLTGDERVGLLENVEETAAQILAGLQEKIQDISVPIGRSEDKIAKTLVGIHYELALGYRCLLAEPQLKGLLRTVDKVAIANGIRGAIYHLGEILRTKYKVLTNPGGTIWQYIYTLFICAYNEDVHSIKLPVSTWRKFQTVEDTFKSILLMSISSPLTMRGSELNDLYDLAPDLAKYIAIGKIKCGENYSDLMTFNLSGTEPPKKQFATGCDSCGNASNCFAVSTTPLLNFLEQQQREPEVAEQAASVKKLLAAQSHLDSLKRNLAGPGRTGDTERIKGGGIRVEMVVGINDAYSYLEKNSFDNTNEDRPENGAADDWDTIGDESITVEGMDNWTTTGIIKAGLRKTSCRVINHSSSGYCLSLDASERFHLRVGELAIVKEAGKDGWHMAAIVWLSGSSERTDFGIKLLNGKVSVGSLSEVQSKAVDLDCLFLTTNSEEERQVNIITASPVLRAGDNVIAHYQGDKYHVNISSINSRTKGYTEYICDWSSVNDNADITKDVEPELNKSTEDDFEAIWDLI